MTPEKIKNVFSNLGDRSELQSTIESGRIKSRNNGSGGKIMFDDLIGARLLSMNDYGFSVKLESGEIRHYKFWECDVEDEDELYGYSEVSAKLLFSDGDMPAITSVKTDPVKRCEGEKLRITFFGADKKLAEIESHSLSGSGYEYGSCVEVECVETGETVTLTSW